MEAKFIKCQNVVVNANDILSITTHDQDLYITCKNKIHRIYFSSEHAAQEELNRIYNLIK